MILAHPNTACRSPCRPGHGRFAESAYRVIDESKHDERPGELVAEQGLDVRNRRAVSSSGRECRRLRPISLWVLLIDQAAFLA